MKDGKAKALRYVEKSWNSSPPIVISNECARPACPGATGKEGPQSFNIPVWARGATARPGATEAGECPAEKNPVWAREAGQCHGEKNPVWARVWAREKSYQHSVWSRYHKISPGACPEQKY